MSAALALQRGHHGLGASSRDASAGATGQRVVTAGRSVIAGPLPSSPCSSPPPSGSGKARGPVSQAAEESSSTGNTAHNHSANPYYGSANATGRGEPSFLSRSAGRPMVADMLRSLQGDTVAAALQHGQALDQSARAARTGRGFTVESPGGGQQNLAASDAVQQGALGSSGPGRVGGVAPAVNGRRRSGGQRRPITINQVAGGMPVNMGQLPPFPTLHGPGLGADDGSRVARGGEPGRGGSRRALSSDDGVWSGHTQATAMPRHNSLGAAPTPPADLEVGKLGSYLPLPVTPRSYAAGRNSSQDQDPGRAMLVSPSRKQAFSSPLRPPVKEGQIAVLTSLAMEPNSGYRNHMEDSAVVVDPYMVDEAGADGEQWGYFAVYDGHGGRQAVDYCESTLHNIVLSELHALRSAPPSRNAGVSSRSVLSDEAIAEALTRAFQLIDDQLRLVGAWRCGCTATIAIMHKTATAMRLHVANVGDSRAVAVDCANVEWRVSQDHRPNDPSEVRRIESEGGFVTRGRVAGQLGVSRALGDHSLKNVGVSCRPYVCSRDATRDVALVLASDGLWDSMCDAAARQTVEQCVSERTPERAAHMLVEDAKNCGSTDNITCLVVFFGGLPMALQT